MPDYPDEELPAMTLSLEEFNTIARDLLTKSCEEEVDPLHHEFTNFVLSGRFIDDNGQEHRVSIDPTKGITPTSDLEDITITRDYDSLIGISTRLPFRCPLSVLPLVNFKESLSRSNHIKWCVNAPEGGTRKHVSLHRIPNVCFGKTSLRGKTLLFFPNLYHDAGSDKLTQEHLATLYDRCLRPTVSAVCGEHIAHWPPSYDACMKNSKDFKGQMHYQTIDIRAENLAQFNAQLRTRMAEFPEFADSFYVHEWKATKGATAHSPEDEVDVDAGLDIAMESIDLGDLGDPPNLEHWYIDVGIEVRCPGHIVQWLATGHDAIMEYALPSLEEGRRERIQRSQFFQQDVVALLYDFAGFRVELTGADTADDIVYLNVYTTDKTPTYQQHGGRFRRHRCKDLLPTQIERLSRDIEALGKVYDMCAGSTVEGEQQEGCARLEGRVRMGGGAMLTKFVDIPADLINHAICAVPAAAWWSFKVWRLTALNNIIRVLESLPIGVRVMRPCLRIGAIAIWMLNGLIYRPGDQRWDRLLVPGTAAAQAVVEGDGDDLEQPVADGAAAPMLNERGAYFVSAIESDQGMLRCATARELGLHDYCIIYNAESWRALEHSFRSTATKRKRKAEGTKRRTRTRPIYEGGRDSPERNLDLGLEEAGVTLKPQVMMTGRDIRPDQVRPMNDAEENANASTRVNRLWRQWLRDVLRATPTSDGASFCTMSPTDLNNVTEATYTSTTLPFRTAWIKTADASTWRLLFDRFFPSRAELVGGRNASPGQHYGTSGYWLDWVALMDNTQDNDDEMIRGRLRVEFDKLIWMPWGNKDRMWASGTTDKGKPRRLPEGALGSAPKLAINPKAGKDLERFCLQ